MALPPEVLQNVRASLAKAEEGMKTAEKDIQDAERAGLDVKDLKTRLEALRLQVNQMRLVYGG